MTLTTPPAAVKVTIRRKTAAVQSRFSVPESSAMRAPADSATHSTGSPRSSARSIAATIRRHSASPSEPISIVASPMTSMRVKPSGKRADQLVIRPSTTPAGFSPQARSRTGANRLPAGPSRSSSSKRPRSMPSMRGAMSQLTTS